MSARVLSLSSPCPSPYGQNPRWFCHVIDVRHCQTNLSGPTKGAGLRRSGRQLTPLGQGGRTVLFEDVAAVEVTGVVEVVVD